MSVNKVILIGNLGADPDVRYTAGGDAVANMRLATTDKWKDKQSGEQREATEWHRVVFYRKLAEVVAEYLKKGSQVYIEGRIKTRKWQNKEGVDQYTTEIEATELQMLGGRSAGRQSEDAGGDQNTAPTGHQPKPSFDDLGNDMPF